MSENQQPQIPNEEKVLGKLEESEVQELDVLKQQANHYALRVGELELEKVQQIGLWRACNERAEAILKEVGKRLDIPEGQPWQITGDGTVSLRKLPVPPKE
jgi:hypothetical protein